MRFLVTGNPHSGTGYMAALMGSFGFDVGHETIRNDGMSCWAWAVDDPRPVFAPAPRLEYAWDTLIHVVRDPLENIASLRYDAESTQREFRRRHVVVTETDAWAAAAVEVVQWNRIIAAQGPHITLRVEEAPEQLARALGKQPVGELPKTTVNRRNRPRPDRNAIIRSLPQSVLRFVETEMDRYGYVFPRAA